MAAANSKTPEKATDLLLDDLPNIEQPATGSWECPSNYHSDRYAPFLKHIADLTGTQVTYDELGDKVDVLGKDAAIVQETIDRLTHMHSALSLLTPVPTSHQHHMFLPAKGYDELQVIPFRHHSAAATVRTLTSTDEWKSLTAMGVLVPFRQVVRPKDNKSTTATATPRPPVASRFLAGNSFNMFGNFDMYNKTSESSSASSAADQVVSNPEPPEPILTLRPKDYYSILASENADRVTKWVDQSKATGSEAPPVDPQQPVPLEEYPPEQKPVRGVLKRRPKMTSNTSPKKSVPKTEEEQDSGEPKTAPSWSPLKPKPAPTLHRTMAQKASPSKSPLKQATLDDYWSSAFATFKKKPSSSNSEPRESSPSATSRPTTTTEENQLDASVESSVPTQEDVKEVQKATAKPALHADSPDVREIFNALRPTLEAARSFPGSLQLEANIELITIAPLSPDQSFDNSVVTLHDWKDNFRPKKGISLAPYWAWNKVTGSGADVDEMIDVIWSKKNPQRIFHEMPAGHEVAFEYHCRMKDGSTFVISLDEAGHSSFQHTPTVLGCSTVHFPHRMWDMNIVLRGEMNLHSYRDPALKKAIDDFVMTIYFEPGDDLIIFCSMPKNKIFWVEKILMKSTVRHRHRPLNEESSSELMLQTVEVRQFLTARKNGHPRLLRGRIPVNNRQECVAARLLWYEVSVVSDAIQKLLTANRELELGQQTQKWSAVDLLGDEIEIGNGSLDSNAVAQSVGDSGFGSIYRLGKVILDRMRIGEAQLS